MRDFIKQHIFKEENVEKFYLSPYINIKEIDEGVFVSRTDLDNGFIFEDNRVADVLMKISYGIDIEDLSKLIENELNENAENFIEFCIQKGIIE
jgi:hypothetical protein